MAGGNDSFTKVLLHCDGANAGTTFTDNNFGGAAKTWTANSATTSTTQVKFGTASGSFSGTTSWIDTPDSSDFTVGTGDYTIDFWFWVSGGSGAARQAFGQMDSAATTTTTSYYGGLNSSNVFTFNTYVGTTISTVTGTTTFTTTGWHHVAMVRASGALKMFLDGAQEGGNISQAGTTNDSANKFSVGRAGELASNTWNGFIDEFRLSVGIARWTSNFTPSTTAYDLGLTAATGAFLETGNASVFNISQTSTTGSFAETGIAAAFNISLATTVRSYAVSGIAALSSVNFAAGVGAFAVSGPAAVFSMFMEAPTGFYVVSGNSASFSSSIRRALYLRGVSYWKGVS